MSYRKIAYIFSSFVLGFGAAGCGESDHITNTPPTPTPNPTPVVTDFYVSPTCSDCKIEVKTQPGGTIDDVLGHGYDATGVYLAPSSIRPSVIDLDKQRQKNVLQIFQAPSTSFGNSLTGENPNDFLSALMANAALSPAGVSNSYYFNGTLNSYSTNSTYIMQNNWVRQCIGKVHTTQVYLKQTLSDEFVTDTAKLTPSALVEKYGTHFLVSASMGISVRSLYSAFVDAAASEKVALASKGSELALLSLQDKLGPNLSLSLAGINNFGGTLTMTFSGGDSRLIQYDPETGVLGDYSLWQESADNSNLSLITLSDGDLLPLSEAVNDKNLKEKIDKASANYVAASKVNANATLPLLQNSNGRIYRYVTSYDESLQLENMAGLKSYGMLGCIFRNQVEGTKPLYSYVYSDGSQILSLIQPTNEWKRIGYVMPERSGNTISLYEITDGTRFAYTIEASNSYGSKNEWHPTGMVFYLLRP